MFISLSLNKGCKQKGVYGTACNISCPVACKNKTCHIQHGTCLECEPGLYGNYCKLSCPINCYDNTCHMQNGTCFTCKPGWTGINCKTSKNAYHILCILLHDIRYFILQAFIILKLRVDLKQNKIYFCIIIVL